MDNGMTTQQIYDFELWGLSHENHWAAKIFKAFRREHRQIQMRIKELEIIIAAAKEEVDDKS